MKKTFAIPLAIALAAATGACAKQDAGNALDNNVFVNDETTTDNLAADDGNIAVEPGPGGAANAN